MRYYKLPYYERQSIRLPNFDYSREGLFYLTICSYQNKQIFGNLHAGQIVLSEQGKIVEKHLKNFPQYYNNVQMHTYIIMPNHLHFIVEFLDVDACEGAMNRAPTTTLGNVVCAFKAGVTREIGHPVWQRNYYERVIRNEVEYYKIVEYIKNNPNNYEKRNTWFIVHECLNVIYYVR